MQEGLIQAWQGVNSFRAQSEGEFRSWAKKVARGRLANARRRHMAARRTVKCEVSPKAAMLERIGCENDVATNPCSPEEVEALKLALSELDERLRLIIRRRYFDGATFEGIAAEVGCSAGGASTMCQRAIRQLRRAMKKPRALQSKPDTGSVLSRSGDRR